MPAIQIFKGDITQLATEAIVNAANNSLLGGGGVDGAIHRAAGPRLLEACKQLNGCATGQAKLTPAFGLKCNYIIHTVGPIWQGGKNQEAKLLASCYKNSLQLAINHQIKHIAFPNISTGVYGFPKELAAEIALGTTLNFLEGNTAELQVLFVCFDEENYFIYKSKLTD
jgi:O-acetyl-ADP-ribose deacetylase (regulator of RNase III)